MGCVRPRLCAVSYVTKWPGLSHPRSFCPRFLPAACSGEGYFSCVNDRIVLAAGRAARLHPAPAAETDASPGVTRFVTLQRTRRYAVLPCVQAGSVRRAPPGPTMMHASTFLAQGSANLATTGSFRLPRQHRAAGVALPFLRTLGGARTRRRVMMTPRAGEGFIDGSVPGGGRGEGSANFFAEKLVRALGDETASTASPEPFGPAPQHIADSAMHSLNQATSEVNMGWGNELHYLIHHPLQFAVLAAACAGVSLMVVRGRRKIKQMKAEFLAQGIDLTNVDNRVDTLMYLKKMQSAGMLPLGLEVCAMKQAEMEVLFLGPEGVRKWRNYYGQRGIAIESGEDMERVRKYVANLHHLEGCLLRIDNEAFTN